MKNLIPLKRSRTVRPASWLAASAAIVAVTVAGAVAAIATAPGNAAPTNNVDEGAQSSRVARFEHPKLKDGVLTVRGTGASEKIALRLQAGNPEILDVDAGDDGLADFSFDRKEIKAIAVDARPGDDVVRIDEGNGRFTDTIATTLDGEAGNDTLAGGAGAERLLGGRGNDAIDGNGGTDTALMGVGADTFIWDPGDGSDVVEGQAGVDVMRFNGAGGAEQVDLSANGSRLRFFRTQGAITMDTAGVERVDFNALGGADLATVNDLSATDVSDVRVDLAGTLGGATGDGQADRIVVNATDGNDAINVQGDAEVVKVSGLAAGIAIFHAEAANDRLEVNTLAGTDVVDGSGLAAGAIQLLIDGIPVP